MSSNFQYGRRLALRELGGLLFLAGVHSSVHAQPKLKITLVDLKPWSEAGPSGVPSGILVRAAREIDRLSGQELEIIPFPYARALAMLDKGKVDLSWAWRLYALIASLIVSRQSLKWI